MARYIPIDEWPGSIMYASIHGRLYCAAPRGLIPDQPYTMDALRLPSEGEQQQWGPGTLPRMVLDVTSLSDLPQQMRSRALKIAPWNSYLVLQLPQDALVVAYRVNGELPVLDKSMAGQVALASGIDVDGWSAEIRQRHGNEHWYFQAPRRRARNDRDPLFASFQPE